MDYREIDTAEQLLNAFKQCQNAGEEIQLFESLAEREHPPVDAFVEILRKIKLETVLALAIQAFGKITNDDVKATLKGSEDLLVMLCEKAKSGATDLIRWSAATTIEKVGFSFIDVCQYLTEEPTGIIQRIVQSKVKVLTDAERNRHGIKENNDYDSFIRFWVYGATYELRAATVNSGGGNAAVVVNAVVKAQDVWGIKQTSFLFLALENHNQIPLQESAKQVYENQLFEGESQSLCSQLLTQNPNPTNFEILASNQIHCLQSNISQIRKEAALVLLSIDIKILDILQQHNHGLESMISIFKKDSYGDQNNFCYQETVDTIKDLEIAERYLARSFVCDHCNKIKEKLLYLIENRKEKIETRKKDINKLSLDIKKALTILEGIDRRVCFKYCNIDYEATPLVDVECDESLMKLNQYYKSKERNLQKIQEILSRSNELLLKKERNDELKSRIVYKMTNIQLMSVKLHAEIVRIMPNLIPDEPEIFFDEYDISLDVLKKYSTLLVGRLTWLDEIRKKLSPFVINEIALFFFCETWDLVKKHSIYKVDTPIFSEYTNSSYIKAATIAEINFSRDKQPESIYTTTIHTKTGITDFDIVLTINKFLELREKATSKYWISCV
jgi:hypothetical protein